MSQGSSFPGEALVRTFEADYEDYLELGLSDCEFSHFTENSHESLPGNNNGAGLDIESEELFWNGINLVGFGMELVKGWAEDDQDLGQARIFYPWAQERFEMTESYGAPESIARFTANYGRRFTERPSMTKRGSSPRYLGHFQPTAAMNIQLLQRAQRLM